MPFCGYDPKMAEGLKQFGVGVARSTIEKAGKVAGGIEEQIEVEIAQLQILIAELEKAERDASDDEAKNRLMALRGAALLCLSAFNKARGWKNPDAFNRWFEIWFDFTGELVRALEDAYQQAEAGNTTTKRCQAGIQAVLALVRQ